MKGCCEIVDSETVLEIIEEGHESIADHGDYVILEMIDHSSESHVAHINIDSLYDLDEGFK